MKEPQRILPLLLIPVLLATASAADIVGREVEYASNGTTLKGYIAFDASVDGKRPGILVVHEWWGHNEYARKRARMLAERGYTALAVDMYGEGRQAEHPDEAGTFAAAVRKNMEAGEARFVAAMALLQKHPTVDPERIGAIGYCFGGGIVLEMARRGIDLDAVVSFHGSLQTEHPALAGAVKGRVLVLNGADDPFVTKDQIDAFRGEMDSAGVRYEFISYVGAVHAFTNPEADAYAARFSIPVGYNAEADAKSWEAMLSLFREVFGG